MWTSYAQNFEDVTLMRAFSNIEGGVYIDVGAQDPVADSVSLAFYGRGWRGVHVEPVPEFAERLRQGRPDETVIQAVIRSTLQPMMFYSVAETGLSTGDPEIAAKHLAEGRSVHTILVESRPLSSVLDEVRDGVVHWLKIDVEGMERAVLESWGDSPVRPWVLVVESTLPNSTQTNHETWEPLVERLGYEFVYFDGLNRFYVSAGHPELKSSFGMPPNYFDDFTLNDYSIFTRSQLGRLREKDAQLEAAAEERAAAAREREALHVRIGELDTLVKVEQDHAAALASLVKDEQDRAATLGSKLSRVQRRLDASEAVVVSLKRDLALASRRGAEARARAEELAPLLAESQHVVAEMRRSRSWRLTAPVRRLSKVFRFGARGASAWLLLRQGSRPRRMAARSAQALASALAATSVTKKTAEIVLAPVPRVRNRLRLIVRSQFANQALTAERVDGLVTGALQAKAAATCYVLVGDTATRPTNTGVQRIVRGLSRALVQAGRPVRFVKWDPVQNACVLIDAGERVGLGRWNGPPVGAEEAALYPPPGHPGRRLAIRPANWLIVPEIQSLSGPDGPMTARVVQWAKEVGLKSGFIFYDAIPLRRPEMAELAPAHAQYMAEMKAADAVWPISHWSANELISFWDDEGPLPLVDPLALPPEFDRPRVASPTQSEKLILCVGTIEPRKNQMSLVRAFQQIKAERPRLDWKLAVVGVMHPVCEEEAESIPPESGIEFLGHIGDTELSELYHRCAFTVFPSLSEGYGLPILESLWQGKPCICANFGAMAEVAEGGGCLTTDVRDPAALKGAVERMIGDAGLRETLAEAAVTRAMPDWSSYVAALEMDLGGGRRYIYYWVDATVITPVNTGIQRVVRQLARSLIESGFNLIPVKWGGHDSPMQACTQQDLEHFALWNGPPPDRWSPWIDPTGQVGGWFLMGELPLHLTDAEQKMLRTQAVQAGLKTAAVFYDTIPWKMRDIYPEDFARRHLLYIGELSQYDRVAAISRYSQSEMIKVLHEDLLAGGDFTNILANPLPAEFPEPLSGPIEEPNFEPDPDRPIEILCVGTVEPRKNHERMLEAFERACERSKAPLRLTLVGGGHSIEPDLAVRVRSKVDANPAITWEEKADDARIQELYRRCDFSIYPSVEEGFGMPILESQWYGRPAICANVGAMAEVAEDGGCLTVDVKDVGAMADAICELANSTTLRARLQTETRSRVFKTWRDYAADMARDLDLWAHPDKAAMRKRRKEMGLEGPPSREIMDELPSQLVLSD